MVSHLLFPYFGSFAVHTKTDDYSQNRTSQNIARIMHIQIQAGESDHHGQNDRSAPQSPIRLHQNGRRDHGRKRMSRGEGIIRRHRNQQRESRINPAGTGPREYLFQHHVTDQKPYQQSGQQDTPLTAITPGAEEQHSYGYPYHPTVPQHAFQRCG